MGKIAFMGAGSTIFAKNVLGDILVTDALRDSEIALYDIDSVRLEESYQVINNINNNSNDGRASIKSYLNRKDALKDAQYIVNAIQVGGYEPSTVIDFEIPKKYGLQQTIADTIGVGGLFRALRTIPVMLEFAKDIEEVCPNALLLNYTNPMATITGAMLRGTNVKTVGLCHSVQDCANHLLRDLEIESKDLNWKIAGINHMAWLLEISDEKKDLYPLIKSRAKSKNQSEKHHDMVRYEMMDRFGYYVTESSEHNAEYLPYFIKSTHPELIDRFNIPLDEYPRRCVEQIKKWKTLGKELIENNNVKHERTLEYASYIIEAMETNVPYKINGNVLNDNLITNLPKKAVVEVTCLVDKNGITPTVVGELPEQLAALNRTNINTQLLTIEAALTLDRNKIYQAAYLDPHTSSELSLDEIKNLCDDLIEAHGDMLPDYN
jgi:alpha-galactosidase